MGGKARGGERRQNERGGEGRGEKEGGGERGKKEKREGGRRKEVERAVRRGKEKQEQFFFWFMRKFITFKSLMQLPTSVASACISEL